MRCPSCSSSAVLYDHTRGELVCTRCGLVIQERVPEPGPEWRRKPGEDLGRADITSVVDVTQHDLGLGSSFGSSRDVSPGWRASLRRLREWQRRSRVGGWRDRGIREALLELDKLCEELALPKGIRAEVSVCYRKARSKKITMGRDVHQVLAALIFITCRVRGLPRTEGEVLRAVSDRFGERRPGPRSFRKLVRLLLRELGIKLPRVSAHDYIDRFAPELGLSRDAVEMAHSLGRRLPRSFTQSKSPIFLAAVALYLGAGSAGQRITLQAIARTVGVGASSISKNLKRVRSLAGLG